MGGPRGQEGSLEEAALDECPREAQVGVAEGRRWVLLGAAPAAAVWKQMSRTSTRRCLEAGDSAGSGCLSWAEAGPLTALRELTWAEGLARPQGWAADAHSAPALITRSGAAGTAQEAAW